MANTNTIVEKYGSTTPNFYPQIAPLVNPNGTAVAFTLAQNGVVTPALGGLTQAAIVSLVSAASFGGPNAAPVGSIWDNGRVWKVRACGTVITAATPNLTVTLYRVPSAIVKAQTATVIGNDVATSVSTGALACIAGTTNWLLDATLSWNSSGVSGGGLLTGTYSGYVGATIVSAAAITPLAVSADTELNFALFGLFSASASTSIVYCDEFAIDQI